MSGNPSKTQAHPVLSLLLGALIISFSGIWVKISEVPSLTSAFYRVFFGFLFLFLFTFFQKTSFLPSKKQLFYILLCGLAFAVDLVCWHAAIGFIGPGLATILGNFQVLILTFIGIIFLQEKINSLFLLSLPLAMLGLFLIVGPDWSTFNANYKYGIYLGLATAGCYAFFLLLLRKLLVMGEKEPFHLPLMHVSFVCAIILAMIMIFQNVSFSIPSATGISALLALGLFSQVIGWILISNAMPHIQASLTGFILLLQPALAFIWDVLFFDRTTDSYSWAGVIISLSAIYMGGRSRK